MWWILSVTLFFSFAGLIFLLKARGLEKEKLRLLMNSKEPTEASKIIKKNISSLVRGFSGKKLWVEVKEKSAVVQFDLHTPFSTAETSKKREANRKFNLGVFKKANAVLLSALQTGLPISWLDTVIVSVFDTRYDKLGDFHKICILSLKAQREKTSEANDKTSFGLLSGYHRVFKNIETRFFMDKDYVLRQVAPYERKLEEELREELEEPLYVEPSLIQVAKEELSQSALKDLACEMVSRWGYEAMNAYKEEPKEADLIAKKSDEIAVVRVRQGALIDKPVVETFYDAMQGQAAAKGYFITDGTFSSEAESWAEGKEIELLDRSQLLKFVDDYLRQAETHKEESLEASSYLEEKEEVEGEKIVLSVKCMSCGWTYDKSLGKCPNCESENLEETFLSDGKEKQDEKSDFSSKTH